MKYKVLLMIGSLASLPVFSAGAETIGEALSKCSEQSNSLQRLVCYDRVVKDMNQYSGLEESATRALPVPVPPPSAGTSAQSTPAPVASPAPNTAATEQAAEPDVAFGLEHKQSVGDNADTLNGVIASLDKNALDKYVITLDNGTVWRQTDTDSLKLAVGEAIYIERGMLGAFYLSRADVNRRIKVTRVK